MVRLIENEEPELAGILAVARLFLLRMPSEAVPLQWNGPRSTVHLEEAQATIVLTKRKNRPTPTTLVRKCCCHTTGRHLCAVHWLHFLRRKRGTHPLVFGLPVHYVRQRMKQLAQEAEVVDWVHVGTRSLRRGMAQDIIDSGNSLAVLLKAGGWSSAAFLDCLRADQASDAAVSQALIYLSDSEEDA